MLIVVFVECESVYLFDDVDWVVVLLLCDDVLCMLVCGVVVY